MAVEQREPVNLVGSVEQLGIGGSDMATGKPFSISRFSLDDAFEEVKANKGSAGVDGVTIGIFERDIDDNLYKLWNRMSSGSYFPKPVKQVLIPKKSGKMRPLGIPTVGDRIAQTVVKNQIEPILETVFHENSYGYRPGRSAHGAIAKTRQRCWRYDWVVEFDIVGLFDSIPHDLLFKAVDFHIQEQWIRLYLRRWCKAPVVETSGKVHERTAGVSQGGVTSPLLANLFMHYAFDRWMDKMFPNAPFERYADDAVIHCVSKRAAEEILAALDARMNECGLALHPEKTRIVYCKDSDRKDGFDNVSFDFLGYTFKPRCAYSKKYNRCFTAFLPAVSRDAGKRFREKLKGMDIQRRVTVDIETVARELNPIITGWMNYSGKFYPSEMSYTMWCVNRRLIRWAMTKHKRLKRRFNRAYKWLKSLAKREPNLFYHWSQGYLP
jgi:group II intron reverse transcriptase/maturase